MTKQTAFIHGIGTLHNNEYLKIILNANLPSFKGLKFTTANGVLSKTFAPVSIKQQKYQIKFSIHNS